MNFVQPNVYLVVEPEINWHNLERYLDDTNQNDFKNDKTYGYARAGLSNAIAQTIVSFAAKLCYKSLALGHNKNIKGVRSIVDNVQGVLSSAHGSVLEHLNFTFVITNVSRIFTHELVRHRAGTAFAQTSGRYVRPEELNFVIRRATYQDEIDFNILEDIYRSAERRVDWDSLNFDEKKAKTSDLRRLLPDSIANEIVLTVNMRTLRHLILLRTHDKAEWEIREVFGQIYNLMSLRYPAFFIDAKQEIVDDLPKITGMKMQPYENNHDEKSKV